MSKVLIVEDDSKVRALLGSLFEDDGWSVERHADAERALESLTSRGESPPDLLVLDVRLPGMSGVELVRLLHERNLLPPAIVVSGEASIREAIEATQHGVHDFIEKPFSPERVLHSARRAVEHFALEREVSRLRAAARDDSEILGETVEIRHVREQIARAAPSTAAVLVRGESGTGKELVAAALHRFSRRSGGPFVAASCAALPPSLIEDELFGHVRGAFTDARQDKAGLFEEANGGTLFLDEIGDMEISLQSRLLRVLENSKIRRVGATRDRAVDVRIVAATHRDLEAAVLGGTFRRDLFYRLAQLVIELPPLRRRIADVPLLFRHFLDRACRRNGFEPYAVERAVFDELERRSWPGNVRELRNLCETLAVFAENPIRPEHLPGERGTNASSVDADLSLKEARRRFEKSHIERCLARSSWNVSAAARSLEVHRSHLHEKMIELGIARPASSSEE